MNNTLYCTDELTMSGPLHISSLFRPIEQLLAFKIVKVSLAQSLFRFNSLSPQDCQVSSRSGQILC